MKLNELSPAKGSTKVRKRVGRGVASGTGKTAGRGTKGYNSRSGGGVRGAQSGHGALRRPPRQGLTGRVDRIPISWVGEPAARRLVGAQDGLGDHAGF